MKLATIDLGSTAYSSQRVVWTKSWTTSIKRAVTIKVLGTSGRPRVAVLGLGRSRSLEATRVAFGSSAKSSSTSSIR